MRLDQNVLRDYLLAILLGSIGVGVLGAALEMLIWGKFRLWLPCTGALAGLVGPFVYRMVRTWSEPKRVRGFPIQECDEHAVSKTSNSGDQTK